MALTTRARKRMLAATLAVVSSVAIVSCGDRQAGVTPSIEQPFPVEIHAGAKTGAYRAFVEQLQNHADNSAASCDSGDESAGCMAAFTFRAACDNGGSETNLKRLGMTEENESELSNGSCDLDDVTRRFDADNGFALVQNAFIYAARAGECGTSDSPECQAKEAITSFANYDRFDELRVVLPISYGRIQVITASNAVDADDNPFTTLSDLDRQKVYVGAGVNAAYGEDIVNQQKQLNPDFSVSLIDSAEALSDLKEMTGLTDDELPKGQKLIGTSLLACGIVQAYVISGELISEVPEFASPAAPNCLARNQDDFGLTHVTIPDEVIDSMLLERPYYQKVDTPASLIREDFRKMPAVTTYLVTTEDTNDVLVHTLTSALLKEWPVLMAQSNDPELVQENIYERPAEFHPGAMTALEAVGYFPLIEIHAGAKTGAYARLIDQLEQRANTFPSDCRQDGGSIEHCLSDFSFRASCNDGGSLTNLKRLGMLNIDGTRSDAGSCQLGNKERSLADKNQFALVQNFFIYGAAAKKCKDKNSPNCRSKAAREDLADFSYFEDLRIVLPISYSRIQLITADSTEPTYSKPVDEMEALAGEKVYLGTGVNATHGRELLERHPRVFAALESSVISKARANIELREKFKKQLARSTGSPLAESIEQSLEGSVCAFFKSDESRDAWKSALIAEYPALKSSIEDIAEKFSTICKNDPVVAEEESKQKQSFLRGLEGSLANDVSLWLDSGPCTIFDETSQRSEWERNLNALGPGLDAEVTRLAGEVENFCNLPGGHRALGNRLLACDIVKAYVISGEFINDGVLEPANATPDFCMQSDAELRLRQIRVPDIIVEDMATAQPYYQKVAPPISLGRKDITSMPAVTTYLVTTANADRDLVKRVTRALQTDWRNLMLLFDDFDFVDLVPLEENIYKQPAPFHDGATDALRDAGLLGKDFIDDPMVAFLWLLAGLIALIVLSLKSEVSYDRLGESAQGKWMASLQWAIAPIRIIFIIAAAAFSLTLVVIAIRGLEMSEASGMGTDNPIASKGFKEVLLWMFTFVTSGFENDVFPQSTLSILIVSLFAVFGVALPIWAIVSVIDRMRETRLARARGGEHRGWLKKIKDWTKELWPRSYRRQGMLLLCGWNDKAPGLVYTLTCPNSPFPGVVNIVADMEEKFPIEKWRFNKRRVRFYRGDPSHRPTLERAEGLRADSALILADYNDGSSANTAGVLTALAIEKLGEKRDDKMFVAAEMTLKEDDRRFSSAHVSDIVDPRLVTRQMLTVACFDEHVQDFVFDALSPDDHCEWYSVEAEKIRELFLPSREKLTVQDYCRALQRHEIVVIGICPKDPSEHGGLFSPDFKEDEFLDPLITKASLEREVPEGSYIVCAAENPKDLRKPKSAGAFGGIEPGTEISFSDRKIVPNDPDGRSVLILGHGNQAESLAEFMRESHKGLPVVTIATDQKNGDTLDDKITQYVTGNELSHVILLSSLPESHGPEEYKRFSRRADSETILRANMIRSALQSKQASAIIVAEVNNTHSRQLARDAKVTTVVPSSLLIERMLARLVSGRGHVSEMLSAMLSTRDGVYLQSVTVDESSPLNGKTFAKAINTWYSDGRVLGLWPSRQESAYKNRSDDFGIHFAMCPTTGAGDLVIRPGDVVIVLRFPTAVDS